jgi:hypothetical protein
MKPIAAIVTVTFLVLAPAARAQEHPEHPKEAQAETPITLDALADAIGLYIQQDAKLKGGYFLVYDTEEKKPLALTLDKVHRDRLSGIGGGVYFACTDMKSAGVPYDLDFFMKRSENGIEITDVSIHKKNGKPRYDWKEESGGWKKVKPKV